MVETARDEWFNASLRGERYRRADFFRFEAL